MTVVLSLTEHPVLYEKIKDAYHIAKYTNRRVWLDANYYYGLERWFNDTHTCKITVVAPSFTSDGNYLNDVKRPYIEFDNEEQLLEFRLKLL